MAIHSENVNFTEQRNDHHSWKYPTHKQEKKNKAESQKAQKNLKQNLKQIWGTKAIGSESVEWS